MHDFSRYRGYNPKISMMIFQKTNCLPPIAESRLTNRFPNALVCSTAFLLLFLILSTTVNINFFITL